MSEHAIRNARGWLSTIVGAMAALEALNDGAESAEFDGETFTDPDDVQNRIQEMPLAVEVRGGWYAPGTDRYEVEAEEFAILLSTGGPALRIYGAVDEIGNCDLQWQDWGTPWTSYRDMTDAEDEALIAFAGMFYLGE
jgi:hypothetical protein